MSPIDDNSLQGISSPPKAIATPHAIGPRPDFSKFFGGRLWINIRNTTDRIQKFNLFPENAVLPEGVEVNFVLFTANERNNSESETSGFYELLHELIYTQDFYIWATRTNIAGGPVTTDNQFLITEGVGRLMHLVTIPRAEKLSKWCLNSDTLFECAVNPMTHLSIELSYSKADTWESHVKFIDANDYHLRKELESTLFIDGDSLIIENNSPNEKIEVDLFHYDFNSLESNGNISCNSWRRYRRFCMMVQNQPVTINSLRLNSENPAQLQEKISIHEMTAFGGKSSQLVTPSTPPQGFIPTNVDYMNQFVLNGKVYISVVILPMTAIQLIPFIESKRGSSPGGNNPWANAVGKSNPLNTLGSNFGKPLPKAQTTIKPSSTPIKPQSSNLIPPLTSLSPLSYGIIDIQ